MEKRKFGVLDFEVSCLSFGGAAVSGEGGGYGFGSMSEPEALNLLRASYDRGINLFDTAPIYGYGMSEQRIGKAFKKNRKDVFIVSKCGVDWDANKKPRVDNGAETTKRMLHQSLKDLDTDYIDLYLVHWPDRDNDIRDTIAVLSEAKKAGKIRAIGLSNFYDTETIDQAAEVDRIDVLQTEFNIFHTEAREKLFPYIKKNNIGFMSWGTFDKGILTGRVTRERTFEKNDFRQLDWAKWSAAEAKMRSMDRINPLLEGEGTDGRKLALGFVLGHPEASTAVCGIKSLSQLETALSALSDRCNENIVKKAVEIAAEELHAPADS